MRPYRKEKVANLVRDIELVTLARDWADRLTAKDYTLKDYPEIRKILKERYGGRTKLVDVG